MIGRFVLDICMLDLYEEWYRMQWEEIGYRGY